jgi:hypothetical protein
MQGTCIKLAGSKRLDRQIRPDAFMIVHGGFGGRRTFQRKDPIDNVGLVGRGQGLRQLFPLAHQALELRAMSLQFLAQPLGLLCADKGQ